MKLKSLFLICSSTIFLMAPLAANAGLITGTFKGIVLASEDSADYSWEGVDVWNGDLAGQEFTGKVWWSTDFPGDGGSTSGVGVYNASINRWVGLEYTIDGKTIVVSDSEYPFMENDNSGAAEFLLIANPSDVTTDGEDLRVADESFYKASNGNYIHKSSNIGVVDLQVGLHGTGLEQAFSYIGPATENYSYAYLFLSGWIDGQALDAEAYMQINEFHIAPAASVPEPSSLILISLGVLGLGWRLRRQNSQR